MADDEQSLLTAMIAGSTRAFESIYLAHKDDLLTVLVWFLKDRAMAEDVLHDTFVSLSRGDRPISLRGSLRSYLVTSCINRAKDLIRRRNKGLELTRNKANVRFVTEDDPSEAVIAEERRRTLADAVAGLPDEQREVVALRTYGTLTFQEIASLLVVSVNTVKSRYRYALTSLQATLAHKAGRERIHASPESCRRKTTTGGSEDNA